MNGIASLPYEVYEEPQVPIGGINSFKKAADILADHGRHGDIYVIHAAEGESVIPMEVLNANPRMKKTLFKQMEDMGLDPQQYIVGNELNSINPTTGIREFGWFSRIVRSVKKVVKKLAPIVLPIVAPFIFPAMPVMLAAGLGSFGGNLIAGRSIKDSLKSAAIAAAMAGAGNWAFGGQGAQFNPFKEGFGKGFGTGSFWGSRLNPSGSFGDMFKGGIGDMFTPVNPFAGAPPIPQGTPSQGQFGTADPGAATKVGFERSINVPVAETSLVKDVPTPPTFMEKYVKQPFREYVYNPDPNVTNVMPPVGGAPPTLETTGEGYLESIFSPNRAGIQPQNIKLEAGIDAASQANQLARAFNAPPPSGQDLMNIAIDTSAKTPAVAPGMLKKYLPAALGVGATALGVEMAAPGTFMPVDEDGDGVPEYWTNGYDMYQQDPSKYGFGDRFYGSNPYYQDPGFTPPALQSAMVAGGGAINGAGTSTSDSIPAMLSDGEFVMNAQAVRGAGAGDRRKGAQRMYALMRQFEGRT